MAAVNTFPTISELVKHISTPDLDDRSELIKERFAVEFGNLSVDELEALPEATQVAIGISSKCLTKLGSDLSWQSVLQNTMNNPSLHAVDSKDTYHHAEHKTSVKKWFQDNGRLSQAGLRKLDQWMNEFIPSKNIFDDNKVSMEFCLKVVQRTLVELRKCSAEKPGSSMFDAMKDYWNHSTSWLSESVFGGETNHGPVEVDSDNDGENGDLPSASDLLKAAEMAVKMPKTTHSESPLVDIVVFRFPDKKQKQFVLYNLKLSIWTSVTEPNPVTRQEHKVQVGTRGEYLLRAFDVRETFVREIKEETREKALQEARNLATRSVEKK